MNKWLVFSRATGQGIQMIDCPESDVREMTVRMGTGFTAASQETSDSHYVDLGSNNLVAKPPQPSKHHTFNWQTKQWQDPRTLQDLQTAQWATIKQARDAAELGPFSCNGMRFDGDLNAQRRLAAYISVSKSAIAAGQPFSAEFTLADNTLVMLSAQDFVGIELAKVQSVAAAFAHATALRAQIEAASTAAQVAAVVW